MDVQVGKGRSGATAAAKNAPAGARMSAGERFRAFLSLRAEDPARFWLRCLFWTFWFHLAFFCLGYGFREVMPVVSLVCLIQYYRHGWRDSVLRTLAVRPLFYCLWTMMFVGVAFSLDPWQSFLETATSFNKGLILPFLGMEAVRSRKDLGRLSVAALIAFCWVGVDGVWQALTGHDFVMGYPTRSGRLTSALGDYCVGNYMALLLPPACGAWFVLRGRVGVTAATALFLLLAAPGFFTLLGAQARAAFVALGAGLYVWFFMLRFRGWLILCLGIAALFLAVYFGAGLNQGRLGVETMANDGRWDLWRLAWAVIREWPVFGAGAEMYNQAFRSLGLVPTRDAITIEHPHNLYLDMLVCSGVVGTIFGCVFLFGVLYWLARNILPFVRVTWRPEKPTSRPGNSRLWWLLTGLFALSYVVWLVNGVVGHEFFRMWWLAQAMLSLGVALGAVELARRERKADGTGTRAATASGTAGLAQAAPTARETRAARETQAVQTAQAAGSHATAAARSARRP